MIQWLKAPMPRWVFCFVMLLIAIFPEMPITISQMIYSIMPIQEINQNE